MDNNIEDEISFKELIKICIGWFNYLKSKWQIILLFGFIGSLIGFGYSYVKKPVYTANLTFALEDKSSSGASGLSSIASSFGLNLGGGEGGAFAGDNIMELMKSRFLIEKTLLSKININGKEDLLINRFIIFNKLNEQWSKNPEMKNISFDNISRDNFLRSQDSVLGIIQSGISKTNLSVSKIDKKLSIISVNVNSKDELFAKLFCENLVKNVTAFYVETKIGKSKNNIKLLESRVDSVKIELDEAMYGRAIFADQNTGLIRQSAAVPKLKQEMKVQMLATLYGELVKNLEFSKLTLMREEPLIQIIDSPIFPLQKQRVGMVKSILLGGSLAIFFVVFMIVGRKILTGLFV